MPIFFVADGVGNNFPVCPIEISTVSIDEIPTISHTFATVFFFLIYKNNYEN